MKKNEKIVSVSNLTKYYSNLKAVDNVSLAINCGEIFCFLGANGAGKSTIIKLLFGLNEFSDKDSGEISVYGLNVKQKNNLQIIRKNIGYVPEERVLIEDLSGEEYVDFMAKLYQKNELEILKQKEYLFELFRLTERKKHLIRFYSNGMKKKILLIGALVHQPDLLIVDEPFAALDPESIYILKQLFVVLSAKGCTIVLSSHNLKIIEDICSRIVILNHGKLLFRGNKNQLFRQCNTRDLESSYVHLIKGKDEIRKINDYIHSIPYAAEDLAK